MSDRLPFDDEEPVAKVEPPLVDAQARARAVNPSENVVLEASAGTGKTRVLVERYVRLLLAGVAPEHILAITFTRKAAAEMRQRIIERLKEASRTSELDAARWRDLRDRLGDIAISTIDAFCLSLLREFPLEADVDPAFDLADETEVPRLVDEALDHALRVARALAGEDDDVGLVFAQLGERRIRSGLAALLERRLVAPDVLQRFLQGGPRDLTPAVVCRRAAERLRGCLLAVDGGLEVFLADGPVARPQFSMLAADLRALVAGSGDFETRPAQALLRVTIDRVRSYFMTQQGQPRLGAFTGTGFNAEDCRSSAAWKRHRGCAAAIAPGVAEAVRAFRRDLNAVMARGVWRLFGLARGIFERTLDAHGVLDFSGVLERALDLLRQMDEFARSRYRLEARYHHVLVDEFQDTSRAQWALVSQLVRSWGEGLGAASDVLPPSIFIVGDRKQSIYGFRDADVSVFDEATRFVEALRPESTPRAAITVSFRAHPSLLAFVNAAFAEIEREEGAQTAHRRDRFRYGADDRFPLHAASAESRDDGRLGLIVRDTVREAAEAVAEEVVRLLAGSTVRDRQTGVPRPTTPADIAILFRSRESHREYEAALERRGVVTYVYKGLGFFEADEIQDAVAVLRFLADPTSDLRAAALLRSRLVRLSDDGLRRLAPGLAGAITGELTADAVEPLSGEDRQLLDRLRVSAGRWLALVDVVTPSELLDEVLGGTAYAYEMRGPRRVQARENLKKLRALVRRIQNHGYATLARIAEHLDRLAIGDESNAAIDAVDAVSLMTVHASKGLEFPIVFVANVGRGTGTTRPPIRVGTGVDGEASVAIADFQSEADEDAQARDREETKRLLYVALTRARDRLYLSATGPAGICRMVRGSLGEVLPRSFQGILPRAYLETLVAWEDGDGVTHRFGVPRVESRGV